MRRSGRGGHVVLLSGGMDSATVLALARRRRGPVHALTLHYGQRHEREIAAAQALARHYRVDAHVVVELPVGALLPSALTDRRRTVPTATTASQRRRIPATYVPARNTIFLSLALGYAEARGLDRIWIGANAIDYAGYPDCRPRYLRAFERLANLATAAGVERRATFHVEAPLLRRSKAQIVRLGERLEVPWAITWSCYRGGQRPCGRCDSCQWRAKGFREAGVNDPGLRRGRAT